MIRTVITVLATVLAAVVLAVLLPLADSAVRIVDVQPDVPSGSLQ